MNAAQWASWLATQSAQVALLFALVFVLDALVARRGSVRLRAALWAVFLVKLVLPPQISSPLSVARLFEGRFDAARFSYDVAPAGSAGASAALVLNVALWAWGIGFLACAWIAVLRMRRARSEWIDGARSAPHDAVASLDELARRVGFSRSPRLLVRDDVESAAAVGLWMPVVVVPAKLVAGGAPRALEHVLLHELAHIRRRDAIQDALWTAARCVYWFHPCVHVAARRAALVREMACDEFAAGTSCDGAIGYRRTLLELARPLAHAAPSLSAFGAPSAMIIARLERLARPRVLSASRPARRLDATPAATFVVLCACCVPLGVARAASPCSPSLDDVQGCLRKRYLVMAELARSEAKHADARP